MKKALRTFRRKYIKAPLQKLGYRVVFKVVKERDEHQVVIPSAHYAPWSKDAEFQDILKKIDGFTLVDHYRCYELWSLVEQTKSLDGDIIEIGVWRGGTGAVLAAKAKQLGLDATVLLCDTFEGVVKAGDKDPVYVGGEHRDTSVELVEGLMSDCGLDNVKILKGIFPDDAGDAISDKRFKLCHIDVDVYQSGKECFDYVWERMDPGAVVVFDDYGCKNCMGITQLVDELKERDDNLYVHNLNGHALIVKV